MNQASEALTGRDMPPTKAVAAAGRPALEPLCFSDALLVAVLTMRPIVDILYESVPVKFLYMSSLFGAAYLAYAGRTLQNPGRLTNGLASRDGNAMVWVVLSGYLTFLLVLVAFRGGSIIEIFKVASPFLLYLAVAPNYSRHVGTAVAVSSWFVILANLALVPFDYGWVLWGSTMTLKGYFFFKTDLAFAVTAALLAIANHFRFRLNPWLVGAILITAVEVILSNSRMNYLTFALVTLFIMTKDHTHAMDIAMRVALAAAVVAVAVSLYDSRTFLSFDTSDIRGFTQGRTDIWDVLINEGLAKNSISEWLFGGGLNRDQMLYFEYGESSDVHNAHNEYLWELITQGVFGLCTYVTLWVFIVNDAMRKGGRPGSRQVALIAVLLLALQAMTSGISLIASKTFPVIFILLALRDPSNR